MDRRGQGYGFASRLSDEKVYRTAHSLIKRLSRHKARRGILHSFRHETIYDAQDENCKQFAN